mmetsp:Transcript_16407/g.30689  ORF Transcript_16407/g.30689 Transcript_16407/m.30689 type:complete len:302 (+) Transcript_16407:1247-2152(+)
MFLHLGPGPSPPSRNLEAHEQYSMAPTRVGVGRSGPRRPVISSRLNQAHDVVLAVDDVLRKSGEANLLFGVLKALDDLAGVQEVVELPPVNLKEGHRDDEVFELLLLPSLEDVPGRQVVEALVAVQHATALPAPVASHLRAHHGEGLARSGLAVRENAPPPSVKHGGNEIARGALVDVPVEGVRVEGVVEGEVARLHLPSQVDPGLGLVDDDVPVNRDRLNDVHVLHLALLLGQRPLPHDDPDPHIVVNVVGLAGVLGVVHEASAVVNEVLPCLSVLVALVRHSFLGHVWARGRRARPNFV